MNGKKEKKDETNWDLCLFKECNTLTSQNNIVFYLHFFCIYLKDKQVNKNKTKRFPFDSNFTKCI